MNRDKSFVKTYLVDLSLMIFLWLFAPYVVIRLYVLDLIAINPTGWLSDEDVGTFFCIPLVAAFWLPVRLTRLIYRLTEIPRREQVAVTLLTAKTHLKKHLLPPILFAAAGLAVWIVAVAAIGLIWWRTYHLQGSAAMIAGVNNMMSRLLFYGVTAGFCMFFVNLAGVFGMLCRCCRRRSPDAVFLLALYIVVCLFLLSLWYYLLPSIFNGSLRPPLFPFLLYYFLPGALGLLFAWRHWLEACEAYYRFD